LNDTNCFAKVGEKLTLFVHVDRMHCFPDELSKEEGIKELTKLLTAVYNPPQPLSLKPSTAMLNATNTAAKSDEAAKVNKPPEPVKLRKPTKTARAKASETDSIGNAGMHDAVSINDTSIRE